MLKLYGSARSSAAFRVRIALHCKRLPFDYVPVRLAKGEHFEPAFAGLNPSRLVPVLEDAGRILTQSLAIIEYLDETRPEIPLLPADPVERAYVRAASLLIACEIHPLNNLRVLGYLTGKLSVSEEAKNAWYRHWIADGLGKLEAMLAREARHGRYTLGERPTMADAALVPQIFNARRMACDLGAFPTLMGVFDACMQEAPFQAAAPERQPDFT